MPLVSPNPANTSELLSAPMRAPAAAVRPGSHMGENKTPRSVARREEGGEGDGGGTSMMWRSVRAAETARFAVRLGLDLSPKAVQHLPN